VGEKFGSLEELAVSKGRTRGGSGPKCCFITDAGPVPASDGAQFFHDADVVCEGADKCLGCGSSRECEPIRKPFEWIRRRRTGTMV